MPRTVHIFPGPVVEYREPLGQGERIVRVVMNLPNPRIITFYSPSDKSLPPQPLSLFLDEIEGFCSDAKARLAQPPTTLP